MSESMDHKETAEMLQKVSLLFLKYGLKNVTMDDIAKDLGISKKNALYSLP